MVKNGFLTSIVSVAATIIIVIGIVLFLGTFSISGAIDKLEGEGYIVLAAGEYEDLVDQLDRLIVRIENPDYLYPESVNSTVTFTCGNGIDTFGAWAEIVDSGATTLSSKFAITGRFIESIMTHTYSKANELYVIEISYGASKTVTGRVKVRSDWTYRVNLNSGLIPAGETVYYRMKGETALATLLADFRYYYSP